WLTRARLRDASQAATISRYMSARVFCDSSPDGLSLSRKPTSNRNVTVIGQALNNGQVNILAALVSEGLSLKAHLEHHVRPWFWANIIEASRAATVRSPLLAALEDTDEHPELRSSAYEALQGFFVFEFGQLTSIKRTWEERRSVVMDILNRAMKFTFKPALQ